MLEYRYVQVESLQKEESRAQSADSSKAYSKQAFKKQQKIQSKMHCSLYMRERQERTHSRRQLISHFLPFRQCYKL